MVLAERVEALVQKAIDECEAGWRPRLETALTALDQERRRHSTYVEIANRLAEADRRLIATLQRRNLELADLLGEYRAKLAAKVGTQPKATA